VSPRLVSSGDAEAVPPVPMDKIPFATDDVVAPALSTSALTSGAAEGVPCVSIQKGPVGSEDALTLSSSIKVANLTQ